MSKTIFIDIETNTSDKFIQVFDHDLIEIIRDLYLTDIPQLTSDDKELAPTSAVHINAWKKRIENYHSKLNNRNIESNTLSLNEEDIDCLKSFEPNITINNFPINSGILDIAVILYHCLRELKQKVLKKIKLLIPEKLLGINIYEIINVVCNTLGIPCDSVQTAPVISNKHTFRLVA